MINSRRFKVDNGELFIAYYEENSELNLSFLPLSDEEKERLSKMKSTLRQTEFKLTRALLYSILPLEKIVYSDSGAPKLQFNSKKISISHSQKCVAIMLAHSDCGLDIELLDRDYLKISHRYLTNNDIKPLSNLEFALYWATKEAIYKLAKGKDIDIFTDISIKNIKYDNFTENSSGYIYVEVKKDPIKAYFLVEKGQVIVYSNKISSNN
ncbi:MAG: hypothetical protein R3Y50_01185 [Rikenellaceae bacterium]